MRPFCAGLLHIIPKKGVYWRGKQLMVKVKFCEKGDLSAISRTRVFVLGPETKKVPVEV